MSITLKDIEIGASKVLSLLTLIEAATGACGPLGAAVTSAINSAVTTAIHGPPPGGSIDISIAHLKATLDSAAATEAADDAAAAAIEDARFPKT